MKRMIIMVLFFLLVPTTLLAESNFALRGKMSIGGELGFSYNTIDYKDSYFNRSSTIVLFNPQFKYFVIDGFSVGFGLPLQFNRTRSKVESCVYPSGSCTRYTETNDQMSYGFNAIPSYYFATKSIFYPFISLYGGGSYGNLSVGRSGAGSADYVVTNYLAGAGVGVAIALGSDDLGGLLDISLKYLYTWKNIKSNASSYEYVREMGNLFFGLGYSIYF